MQSQKHLRSRENGEPYWRTTLRDLLSGKISPFGAEVIKVLQTKYDQQGGRCFGKKFRSSGARLVILRFYAIHRTADGEKRRLGDGEKQGQTRRRGRGGSRQFIDL